VLDWQPKVCFQELVHIMLDADLGLVVLELPGEGQRMLQYFDSWHCWEDQIVSMEKTS